jgi:hypothetical protein
VRCRKKPSGFRLGLEANRSGCPDSNGGLVDPNDARYRAALHPDAVRPVSPETLGLVTEWSRIGHNWPLQPSIGRFGVFAELQVLPRERNLNNIIGEPRQHTQTLFGRRLGAPSRCTGGVNQDRASGDAASDGDGSRSCRLRLRDEAIRWMTINASVLTLALHAGADVAEHERRT